MDPASLPELLVQFVNNEEVAAQVLGVFQQNPQAFLHLLQNTGGVPNQRLSQVPGAAVPAVQNALQTLVQTSMNAPVFSPSDREAIQRVGCAQSRSYSSYNKAPL